MKASVVWKKSAVSDEGKPAPVISALEIGNPGKLAFSHVIVGTELGSVLFYPLFHRTSSDSEGALECQGSSITSLHLCKMFSTLKDDIVVGDAAGNVQTFLNGSSVCRVKVDQPISALLLDRDLYANPSLLVGDFRGHIAGFVPMINNEKCFKVSIGHNPTSQGRYGHDWRILDLISYVSRPVQTNVLSHYTIVATRSQTLRFYSGSSQVFSIDFPSPIRAVCTGFFTVPDEGRGEQIAVALDNGEVHLVSNFEAAYWISTDLTLTSISALRNPSASPNTPRSDDVLLGIGHFNGVVGYQASKKVLHHETSDWVHLMRVKELKAPDSSKLPNRDYLTIALLDNSIEVLDLC